jgi:hypothetical protein
VVDAHAALLLAGATCVVIRGASSMVVTLAGVTAAACREDLDDRLGPRQA